MECLPGYSWESGGFCMRVEPVEFHWNGILLVGFCWNGAPWQGIQPSVSHDVLCPQRSLATRGEDWASQGQPKGKAEIPVVSRECRRIMGTLCNNSLPVTLGNFPVCF